MLKAPVRPPVPGHSEFLRAFTALFGGDSAEPVAVDLVGAIDAVCHDPVTAGEVECAARAMAAGKSTALGQVPVEYVCGHHSAAIWEVFAELFNCFVARGYPAVLNHMLMMPLHKKDDPADCGNYRGISLMHPWGRLFSKLVVHRLERDPAAVRAQA